MSTLEFGAHQVIIVRTEEAKKSLPKELRQCLVMTTEEVKGLEFEDVFVYNFFADSQDNTNWEGIRHYYHSQLGILDKKLHYIPFDAEKDRILCSELKTLYMVITRARQNLFFFDQSMRIEPLLEMWKANQMVFVASNAKAFRSHNTLLKKSSPDQWVCT